MKIINHIISLKTTATLDFIDITDRIRRKIKEAGVKNGWENNYSTVTLLVKFLGLSTS